MNPLVAFNLEGLLLALPGVGEGVRHGHAASGEGEQGLIEIIEKPATCCAEG